MHAYICYKYNNYSMSLQKKLKKYTYYSVLCMHLYASYFLTCTKIIIHQSVFSFHRISPSCIEDCITQF